MAGHSRPKDGVASLAYVPAIHALLCGQGVDAPTSAGMTCGQGGANQLENTLNRLVARERRPIA